MPEKVKLSHLIENLDGMPGDDFYLFLNRYTGKVIMVSAEEYRMVEEGEEAIDTADMDDELREVIAVVEDEDDNYVSLPDKFEIDEYGMMEDFCLEIEEPEIQGILYRAIKGKGAFRRFRDAVRDLGVQDDWHVFREQKFKEFAIEWCRDHQVEYIDDIKSPEINPGKKLKNAPHAEGQVKNGRYRHYKGREYQVIAVAKHSETEEEYVVYRALYGDGGFWVRPKTMFVEKIVIDGKIVPRFEYLGEK